MKMCLNMDTLAWIVVSVLVPLAVRPGYAEVPRDEFFPFGVSHGDTTLDPACHRCSDSVSLKFPLTFFNITYNTSYVSNRGFISFESGLEEDNLYWACDDKRGNYGPLLAPLYSFRVISHGGRVYFRESSSTTLISKAEVEIRKGFPDVGNLSLKSVFIATWDEMSVHYLECLRRNGRYRNTFQTILTTDGVMTFVILYYNEHRWITNRNSTCTAYPAVGFSAGAGYEFHKVLGDCTANVSQILTESNVGEAGKWLFRVDRGLLSSQFRSCELGQIELDGVTYVKEGCPIRLNCTTDNDNNLTNWLEYKRIAWTKDELFLFGVNTKYRRNHWSWHTSPAPGVFLDFSTNEDSISSIVLVNSTEETSGKYRCAAQPSNKSISEPIFADHLVIVIRKDEEFPPKDTTVFSEIFDDRVEGETSLTHGDIHSMTEVRLIQMENEIQELQKLVVEMRAELSNYKKQDT